MLMIKIGCNHLCTVFCCCLLFSVYSTNLQAQETETESETNTQQEITNENRATDSVEDESVTDTEKQSDTDSETDQAEPEKPTFNVDLLVNRMKETKAIGVITKLSLKNQVDDLLEHANEIKNDNGNITNEKVELREDFEGLILKTITLLNKGEDYTLAEYIYLAREELWKSIMENKA